MENLVTLIEGDCLDKLKEIKSESVHCGITSPPYFALRDYGTAEWEGGDINCKHLSTATGPTNNMGNNDSNGKPYKHTCGLCGAKRKDKQLGLEDTPESYTEKLVLIFREFKRVLRKDGTLWVVIGDSYNGSGGEHKDGANNLTDKKIIKGIRAKNIATIKRKDLIGIPWRFAFAMQADGWYLRSDIIWSKPNPMPESTRDRCTKSHEYIFMFTKRPKYYYDDIAIQEDAICDSAEKRTKRDVWTVNVKGYKDAHFATYPTQLIEPCILAGTSAMGCCLKCGSPLKRILERDNSKKYLTVVPWLTTGWTKTCKCKTTKTKPCTVLDMFSGAGTTGLVAIENNRSYIGIELNPIYIELTRKRFANAQPKMID
jgi:DNA modification methylase